VRRLLGRAARVLRFPVVVHLGAATAGGRALSPVAQARQC